MASKTACHIELCKNRVHKWVQDESINVQHVSGKIKPAGIFTKQMHDGAHFWWLLDSFMSHLSDFINSSLLVIHHIHQRSPNQVIPAAAWAVTKITPLSIFLLWLHVLVVIPSLLSHIFAVLVDSFFRMFMCLSPHFSSNNGFFLHFWKVSVLSLTSVTIPFSAISHSQSIPKVSHLEFHLAFLAWCVW
jgi:hypothetical protein